MEHILKIAKKANINEKYIEQYGNDKAKIDLSILSELSTKKDGKLILVTAITPSKVGEGKTTMSIALQDGLRKINEDSLLCLREPSLGPVFGLKGGATGGGKATIEPQDDINLHFTGDMHALTSSINLISAVIDNHIYQGNELNINPEKIVWKRALDMNDRSLREIEIGLGKNNGVIRKDSFVITVASEMMAILCLAKDEDDFKERIKNIIVAYDYDDNPIYLKQLQISNAVMKLMKNALKPNLVQTNEGNPVLVHGGPFANIAHGCNSLIATKLALKLSKYVITEAGFGADLGAEKFLDITSKVGFLTPNAVVVVATIRALKLHGGQLFEELEKENLIALENGFTNLKIHLENMKKYNLPVLVAINHFSSDSENEIALLTSWCDKNNYPVTFVDSFLNGSDGAIDFAKKVKSMVESKSSYKSILDEQKTIKDKIKLIAKEIYRASDVEFSLKAEEQLSFYEKLGYKDLPVCIAKTPLSLSDNPKFEVKGNDHILHVKEINLSSGAGFVVALTGKVMTMPGLPKIPAAVKMEKE